MQSLRHRGGLTLGCKKGKATAPSEFQEKWQKGLQILWLWGGRGEGVIAIKATHLCVSWACANTRAQTHHSGTSDRIMSSFNLMQMVFPFASLFKQQFGKFVIHKAFIVLHTLLPCGPLGAAWMFVDAWKHTLVFNEVVFILFPLVRGALGIAHDRTYFHLKTAATHQSTALMPNQQHCRPRYHRQQIEGRKKSFKIYHGLRKSHTELQVLLKAVESEMALRQGAKRDVLPWMALSLQGWNR